MMMIMMIYIYDDIYIYIYMKYESGLKSSLVEKFR